MVTVFTVGINNLGTLFYLFIDVDNPPPPPSIYNYLYLKLHRNVNSFA